jgi:S1-C subfamily serine protease
VLQGELLKREGGMLQSGTEDLQGGSLARLGEKELQRILGQTGVVTFKWYMRGLSRCVGVAKITTEDDDPVGTGFLVRGKDLAPGLGDEVLLLTNAHVIDDKAAGQNCLRSTQAVITFEAKSRDAVTRGVSVVWTSPVSQLDATLVRLKDVPVEPDPFPLAADLPLVDGKQRVYVIGHPGGRSLSLSLQDNLLLGCENPLLHYRAPTEQGSSGSPVFNQQWDLIALHHAGSTSMRRLSGQEGTYSANEGIWIQAIRKDLATSFV